MALGEKSVCEQGDYMILVSMYILYLYIPEAESGNLMPYIKKYCCKHIAGK